jgi:hypothetical protein
MNRFDNNNNSINEEYERISYLKNGVIILNQYVDKYIKQNNVGVTCQIGTLKCEDDIQIFNHSLSEILLRTKPLCKKEDKQEFIVYWYNNMQLKIDKNTKLKECYTIKFLEHMNTSLNTEKKTYSIRIMAYEKESYSLLEFPSSIQYSNCQEIERTSYQINDNLIVNFDKVKENSEIYYMISLEVGKPMGRDMKNTCQDTFLQIHQIIETVDNSAKKYIVAQK